MSQVGNMALCTTFQEIHNTHIQQWLLRYGGLNVGLSSQQTSSGSFPVWVRKLHCDYIRKKAIYGIEALDSFAKDVIQLLSQLWSLRAAELISCYRFESNVSQVLTCLS